MKRIRGFPPLIGTESRVLILGSMPGVASLDAHQYYAHPRNAFWPIMQTLLGIPANLTYEARCKALISSGIALWDVLQSCAREGSLDADIQADSIVANDFRSVFSTHPGITRVYFNGSTAEQAFRRHVQPTLPPENLPAHRQRLPATSPAHAALRLDDKITAWRCIVADSTLHTSATRTQKG